MGMSAVKPGCRRESFGATAEDAMNHGASILSRLLTRLLPELLRAWCNGASPGKLKAPGTVYYEMSHG